MEKTKYKIAEEYFINGQYLEAFNIFKYITQSTCNCNDIKSDAYNMMGAIVLFDTTIDNITDESGLNYFVKSLNYNPNNIGALLNIVEQFGISVNCHQDINILNTAINKLKGLNYMHSDDEKAMIVRKLKLRDSLM